MKAPRSRAVSLEKRWELLFEELKAFRLAHGHCNVPEARASRHLRNWVKQQRHAWSVGTLSKHRFQRLQEINFPWKVRDETRWDERFRELQAYRKRFGHCRVAARWPENIPLGRWVACQRAWQRRGWLRDPDRIARLDALGFDWGRPQQRTAYQVQSWEESFAELQAYRKRFGHCNVPKRWRENVQLGQWVGRQRALKRRGRLGDSDRIARLDALGFDWGNPVAVETRTWEETFAELQEFHRDHGHFHVAAHPAAARLRGWMTDQRAAYRRGVLHPDRVQQLQQIGFSWKPRENALWEQRYLELRAFQERFGHCLVPARWPENVPLGRWVACQRAWERQGLLKDRARCARLDALGFDWERQAAERPRTGAPQI